MAAKDDNTTLYAGLGIVAIGAYYFLKPKVAKAADPDPVVAPLANFEAVEDPFDLSYHLEQVVTLAKEGRQGRPVVFMAGMNSAFARGYAAAYPGVDFVWSPKDTAEVSFEVSEWLPSPKLPWVIAVGVPIAAPNAGDTEGEPVAGSAAQNTAYFEQVIEYAMTGAAPGGGEEI